MKKKAPASFVDAPEICLNLYVSLEDVDLVSIGSGDHRVMLNVQEADMLRDWLNKARPQ